MADATRGASDTDVKTDAARLTLRLYVAGDAPNSLLARMNLQRMLGAASAATYDLEIVDCLREPKRALSDGVIVTPTLKKLAPEPLQTIVGALTDAVRVRAALGFRDEA